MIPAQKTLAEARAEMQLQELKEQDFEQYLFQKYPNLFPKDENGDLLSQEHRCWNDCPKGWEDIIDDLCDCIDRYVKGHSTYLPNPKHKIARFFWNRWCKLSHKMHHKSKIKQLGTNFFYHRVKDMYINVSPPPVQIAQYKTKWGQLRFYFDGGDDTVNGMVYLAEMLAAKTCPNTGKRKE